MRDALRSGRACRVSGCVGSKGPRVSSVWRLKKAATASTVCSHRIWHTSRLLPRYLAEKHSFSCPYPKISFPSPTYSCTYRYKWHAGDAVGRYYIKPAALLNREVIQALVQVNTCKSRAAEISRRQAESSREKNDISQPIPHARRSALSGAESPLSPERPRSHHAAGRELTH